MERGPFLSFQVELSHGNARMQDVGDDQRRRAANGRSCFSEKKNEAGFACSYKGGGTRFVQILMLVLRWEEGSGRQRGRNCFGSGREN